MQTNCRLILKLAPLAAVASSASAQARFPSGPATRDRLLGQGAEVVPGSPEQFRCFVRAEMTKSAAVIKRAGIKPDRAERPSTW